MTPREAFEASFPEPLSWFERGMLLCATVGAITITGGALYFFVAVLICMEANH